MNRAIVRRGFGVALLLSVLAPAATAGAIELSLDRTAVRSLVGAVASGRFEMAAPGLGEVALVVGAPGAVAFRDGGVEVELPLGVEPLGLRVSATVRLEPEIQRSTGIVRLVARELVLGDSLPLKLDAAAIVPPVELPRRIGGTFAGPREVQVELDGFVHAVRVEDERVVVELGLRVQTAKRQD
jgi:hypothetical protein